MTLKPALVTQFQFQASLGKKVRLCLKSKQESQVVQAFNSSTQEATRMVYRVSSRATQGAPVSENTDNNNSDRIKSRNLGRVYGWSDTERSMSSDQRMLLRLPEDYAGRKTSVGLKRRNDKSSMVVHTFNPSTENTKAGRLRVQSHPQLHIKCKPSLGIARCIFLAVKIIKDISLRQLCFICYNQVGFFLKISLL